MSSCDVITKTLYRQLLRTTKPFATTNNGPILCSLLHRSGLDDDFIEFTSAEQQQRRPKQQTQTQTQPQKQQQKQKQKRHVYLSKEEARDLSRSYDELREMHYDREKYNTHPDDHEEGGWSTFPHYSYDGDNRSPHAVLYKQILFHLFATNEHGHGHGHGHNQEDGHSSESRYGSKYTSRHMIFPSQTTVTRESQQECIMGERLLNIVRNEFRATIENANNSNKSNKSNINRMNSETENGNSITFSQFYNEPVRKEAGFLALREIQKKLSWAESMGMNNLFQRHRDQSHDTKGPIDASTSRDRTGDDDSESTNVAQIANEKNVHKIPTHPPSSYLRSGTFLVAHPMLTGVFSKSVICILQHTDDSHIKSTKTSISGSSSALHDFVDDDDGKSNKDNDDNNDDEEETKENTEIISNLNGGTYGLIVNSKLRVGVPDQNSNRRRDRTLREVMRHNSLPEGVKIAFGDCPVRHGGPVNLSIQMLRTVSPDEEEKLKIGGTVLPMVLNNDDEEEEEGTKVLSSAMYSDKAVYFGGDIIKAAQAVIDGEIDRDSFSFVIGASCWETGQLEGEIERGYWLPFSCPTVVAHTGTCKQDYDMDQEQPSCSGKSDLWLAAMKLLGFQEGRLALFINEMKQRNQNGDACDEV